jgi:hypothetical protein
VPGCARDFAEQTAAAALRGLGIGGDEAKRISSLRLAAIRRPSAGLFAETVALAA